jgi:hypothetical protein
LLNQHPTGFNDETGRQLVKESRARVLAGTPDLILRAGTDSAALLPPDERIDAAVEEIRAAVAAELLDGGISNGAKVDRRLTAGLETGSSRMGRPFR